MGSLVQIVFSYKNEDEKSTSANVGFDSLKKIALGKKCPSNLREDQIEALIKNQMISLHNGNYSVLDRLFWQTGVDKSEFQSSI